MALMMFSAKNVKRSSGKSIVAAVAYRTGSKLEDIGGQVFDYTPRTKSRGVVHTQIFLPASAPSWAEDRNQLWNAADASERRRDAVTGREFVLNLPHELDDKGRLELLARFSREIIQRHGCAVDAAIHRPDKGGDPRNHHAHLMLSTRRLIAKGFGEKTRELDEKKNPALEQLRETWAQYTNEALAGAGHEARIDHRSYERQGIERKPGLHLGTNASALERMGTLTQRGDYNREIQISQQLAEKAANHQEKTHAHIQRTDAICRYPRSTERYRGLHDVPTLSMARGRSKAPKLMQATKLSDVGLAAREKRNAELSVARTPLIGWDAFIERFNNEWALEKRLKILADVDQLPNDQKKFDELVVLKFNQLLRARYADDKFTEAKKLVREENPDLVQRIRNSNGVKKLLDEEKISRPIDIPPTPENAPKTQNNATHEHIQQRPRPKMR